MPRTRATLSLFAAAVLVALGGSELALRALDLPRFDACRPPAESPWLPDARAFFVLRANAAVGSGHTNARGLRGPVVETARTPGASRVLFVGDSTCWGVGVRYEESFAARSAAAASATLGRPVEVVNACVPNHSSFQARGMVERYRDDRPDVVVAYVGARNDLDRHRYFPDADIPKRLARLHAPWHQIRLLRAAEAARDGLYKSLLRKLLSPAARARVSPEAFRVNVEALLEAARAAGMRPILLQPPWSAEHLARQPLIPELQRALDELATLHGAAAVALQPHFEAGDESVLYVEDGFHFSVEGHALAARVLAPVLVEALAAP